MSEPATVIPHSEATSVPTDAAAAMDRESWLSLIATIAQEEGSFEALGTSHWAFFVDDGTTLMVSFETIEQARARAGQMPLAHDVAAARGWSHLCLIADGNTWYRDPAVWAYFDRLVDDSFFENYDNVLFYGAGMGGYAACAYAVTSPGAAVLALNPRATLSPAEAGWDNRDRAARKLDFTSRYGYAPDMLEGAGRVVVIHDPTIREEAMHAALFRAPFITRLSARHVGEQIESTLSHMGVLSGLIEAAVEGLLDVGTFSRAWRKRRDFAPYLRTLLAKTEVSGRRGLQIRICRNVSTRLHAPRFAKRLARLTAHKSMGTNSGVDALDHDPPDQ